MFLVKSGLQRNVANYIKKQTASCPIKIIFYRLNYIINLISCFISTLKAGYSQCVISIIYINLFYSHPSSIEIFPYSAVSDMNIISLGNSTSCPVHGIRPCDQCEGVAKLLLHCQTLSAPSIL